MRGQGKREGERGQRGVGGAAREDGRRRPRGRPPNRPCAARVGGGAGGAGAPTSVAAVPAAPAGRGRHSRSAARAKGGGRRPQAAPPACAGSSEGGGGGESPRRRGRAPPPSVPAGWRAETAGRRRAAAGRAESRGPCFLCRAGGVCACAGGTRARGRGGGVPRGLNSDSAPLRTLRRCRRQRGGSGTGRNRIASAAARPATGRRPRRGAPRPCRGGKGDLFPSPLPPAPRSHPS